MTIETDEFLDASLREKPVTFEEALFIYRMCQVLIGWISSDVADAFWLGLANRLHISEKTRKEVGAKSIILP